MSKRRASLSSQAWVLPDTMPVGRASQIPPWSARGAAHHKKGRPLQVNIHLPGAGARSCQGRQAGFAGDSSLTPRARVSLASGS